MKTFKEFILNQKLQAQPKWKASKDEIIDFWKKLRPDTPILAQPIHYGHQGSTYGEDGIRITGSPQFIRSVLSRLKEFMNFEASSTKLNVSYRQTESPSKIPSADTRPSYVFYIQVKERGTGEKD